MCELLQDNWTTEDFQPALWINGKVDSNVCCPFLSFDNLKSGCVFDDHLVPCREGRYVAVAEFVHRHETPSEGVVYRRSGNKVVVKAFLDTTLAAKEFFLSRLASFDPESSSRLVHVVAHLKDHNTAYILFDYIEGGDLCSYICSMNGARIPRPVAVQWMADLLHCLKGLHRCGIAHMDLSPEVDELAFLFVSSFPLAHILLCIWFVTCRTSWWTETLSR